MPVTGNTETTQPENRAFFPALDGLRAIAFFMVFLQHYYAIPWGWTGVDIFFVLSGFLITGILFDTRDRPDRVRTFYMRRTLRIFPLYYGLFLGLLLLHPILHWQWSLAWIAWPLYLGNFLRFISPQNAIQGTPERLAGDAQLHSARSTTLTLSLGHFWSLCVEEQFYLMWPWVVFWTRSRRALIWICTLIVVLTPILRAVVHHYAPVWMLKLGLLDRLTPFQIDALLLGGLVALLWRGAHRDLLIKICRILAVVTVVMAVVYCALTFHVHQLAWRANYFYPEWRLTWGLTFINVLSASVIVSVLRPAGILYHILCLRPLRWLGRISYGAYVLHDVFHTAYEVFCARALRFLVTHGGPRFSVLQARQDEIYPLLALGMTFVLASLSFRYLETPFLRLKNRFDTPPIQSLNAEPLKP